MKGLNDIDVRTTPAPQCYLCGATGQMIAAGLTDRLFTAPGVWSSRRCPQCGLVWLDPQPFPQDIGKLYQSYFTHAEEPPPEARPTTPRRLLRRLRRLLRRSLLVAVCDYETGPVGRRARTVGRLLAHAGPVREAVAASVFWLGASERGRLLDVGCGNGAFIAGMANLGWDVAGVEPDRAAVEAAKRRFGLEVMWSSFEEAQFPSDSFDVITMSHVIEHVPDPVRFLREAKRVLKPRGRVVVVTPNTLSFGRRLFRGSWLGWDPPRHLYLFTPALLGICTDRAGLAVEEIRTTANGAPYTWVLSASIRRDGAVPGGTVPSVPWHASLESKVFWAVEYLLTTISPWGEEVVVTATKPD
jgi:SAM-dependent methyltransferase